MMVGMEARSLVFDVGDAVSGWGRLVADADGQWLDLARVLTLGYSPWPRPRSRHSVRLIGATAVPTEFGPNNAIPWAATVIGTWLGDAIKVEAQRPYEPPQQVRVTDWTTPPCPPPPRGWAHGPHNHNPSFDRGDLLNTGAAVTVVTFRPSIDQTVVVVAATDTKAVEAHLRPQLGNRLCVVSSRWTRAQLDQIRRHFTDRWDELGVETVGEHADEYAQPSIEVQLLRVTDELADWADTLPDAILKMTPSLVPAPAA